MSEFQAWDLVFVAESGVVEAGEASLPCLLHNSIPRRLTYVKALAEPIVLTEIGESFIDRSVKYGRNFLSSKRIQDGAKSSHIALEGQGQARGWRRHRLWLFAIRFA